MSLKQKHLTLSEKIKILQFHDEEKVIQQKVLEVREQWQMTDFKASNGWLEKFQTCCNILFKAICGENKEVDRKAVNEWGKNYKKFVNRVTLETFLILTKVDFFFSKYLFPEEHQYEKFLCYLGFQQKSLDAAPPHDGLAV